MANNVETLEGPEDLSNADAALDGAIDKLRGGAAQEEEGDSAADDQAEASLPEEAAPPRKKGSDFVQVDNPKVKERIDYLYLQARSSDERNRMLERQNKELAEALKRLDHNVATIEKKSRESNENQEVTRIKEQIRDARELGDVARELELNDLLIDIRAEQKSRASAADQKPSTQAPADPRTQQDANYIEYLATERDPVGNFKRPYLQSWHPENNRAANEAANIAQEFARAGRNVTLPEIMTELERRMNPTGTSESSPVLNNKRSGPERKQTALSSDQRAIARKMGISEKDYADQVDLLQRVKTRS